MCRSGDVVSGLSAGQSNAVAANGGLSAKLKSLVPTFIGHTDAKLATRAGVQFPGGLPVSISH